jgi:outer membrane protein OmpA-like peptidoglycan-associated protein
MVKREPRSCGCVVGTKPGKAALAALLIGLSGCNPVETYRHWTGIAENDPNPTTTPNTKNLAAGEAASYPNLATVPPPPTQALSTAELNKLTQSLIADRAHAKYTSEQLQAKFDEAAAPPPPAPPPPPASAAPGKPVATRPVPAPTPGAPSNGTPPAGGPVAAAPGVPPPRSVIATAGAAKGARKSGQPPEPGPMESSLQPPQIASLPQPGQFQPAPPPPRELAMPAGANPGAANPGGANPGGANPGGGKPAGAASGAHLPGPPAPAPMPAAIGSAKFQPAPPPPNLPPAAPIRTATATPTGAGKPAKPASTLAYTQVADIAFLGKATTLSDADRQTLGKIVPRYREKPGPVRVVGYAGIGSSAAQQLDSYRTALDRAQAVAAALAKAGIPADKIQVEAAPSGADSGQGRAEILLAQ